MSNKIPILVAVFIGLTTACPSVMVGDGESTVSTGFVDESGATNSEMKVQTRKKWYGMPVVAIDLVADAVTIASVLNEGEAAFFFGLVAGIGGPIVHFINKQWARGFVSLGSRGLLTFLGGMSAVLLSDRYGSCQGEMCDIYAMMVGSAIGLGVAQALDAAVLCWKDVPVEKSQHRMASALLMPGIFLAPDTVGASATVLF